MSPRKMISFELDHDLIDGLKEIQERDGINASEQMRRAIRAWIEERGIRLKGGTAKTTRSKK
jgi:metal-responsive CopG/Arc/MetJ family transcriptional regulator